MTNPLKILVLTPALPQDSVAGKVVLHRHLTQLHDVSLTYASEDPQCRFLENGIFLAENRLAARLNRTRLAPWINGMRYGLRSFFNYRELERFLERYPQDAMLTVAEGPHWTTAIRCARRFRLPLIAIFHDWWPDLVDVPDVWKARVERRFQKLCQDATLAFCVSEGMRAALGDAPQAEVLYPIPDPFLEAERVAEVRNGKFRVVYAGNLSGGHGRMARELAEALEPAPGVEIRLFGGNADWVSETQRRLASRGAYRGYVGREELRRELSSADALLVTTTHETRYARWAETNFPSKLVEYSRYGKPLIVWGPSYASAIRWSAREAAAMVVASPDARDAVAAIVRLADDAAERMRLATKCRDLAQGAFHPERIQRQFAEGVFRAATGARASGGGGRS
jgi:glycosyltransferase involved in cell wall biosynthesis